MLRQIKFKNYRCFEESEISFRNTAIIVGQNNAGKSTIVEALRILSVVAQKFKQLNYAEAPRGLGLPLATRGIKVNLDNLKIDFRSIVATHSVEIISMDQLDRNCRGQASSRKYQIATAELEKRWVTLEDRLSVCNGKDLISRINSLIARQYHQKSSRKKLLDSLKAEDVCDEMKQVILNLIEK